MKLMLFSVLKKAVLLVYLTLIYFTVFSQKRVYFDQNWFAAPIDSAVYYSDIVLQENGKAVVTDYQIDHSLIMECTYQLLRADVIWEKLYEKGFEKMAVEDGVCTAYHLNGQKKKQFNYLKGEQLGFVKIWNEKGELKRDYYAKNMIANGLFKEYNSDGSLNCEVNFKNDTLHGLAKYYHPNGLISHEGKFKKGLKSGKWRYWDEEGTEIAEESYRKTFFIQGPDLVITFPEGIWCLSDQYEDGGRMNFLFSRAGNQQTLMTEFLPTCLVSMENVRNNHSIVDYSSMRRRRMALDVYKVITKEQSFFKVDNSMGYLTTYSDEQANSHVAIVLHTIQKGIGFELVLDCRKEDYKNLQKEIYKILRSIRTIERLDREISNKLDLE